MAKSTTNAIQAQIRQVTQSLHELAREGARRTIAEALELEVEECIQRLRHLCDDNDHALVVRNGKAQPRTVSLGAGGIKLQAPRVDDRRAEHRFTSKILPPYVRRSPRLNDALPVLYLRGLSTGDIESTFSTVRDRAKRAKGAGSRKAGLAMAFKLLLGAERRWRKIDAPHLVALVQAGISFPDGQQLALKAA